MTHDTIVLLAALGVAGQALFVLLLLVGWRIRAWLEGYELWLAFVVSAIATGGSLLRHPSEARAAGALRRKCSRPPPA